MCFSVTASFAASGALATIGLIGISYIRSREQVLLGIIPFQFSLHQFIEGLMWLNLENQGSQAASVVIGFVYMFLSGLMWPIWMPMCLIPLERDKKKKIIISLFMLAGIIFGPYFYFLALRDGIEPRILGGHIQYIPVTLSYLLAYCFITITPSFIITTKPTIYFKIFGALMWLSFLAGYITYKSCAASIWCFFAAICSISIIPILINLNKNTARE